MKRFRIYPYKLGSASATALGQRLNCLKVKPDGRYIPRPDDIIINWGMGKGHEWPINPTKMFNPPERVNRAGNKLQCFQSMERGGVSIPRFTTNREEAESWDVPVVARHKLRGHSGDGAEYYEDTAQLPDAPLYVEYKKKRREFRIHVFQGQVFDIQEKKKRREVENDDVDYKIRNKYTGWVYCRDIEHTPDSVLSNAILAVDATSLDFGAVDVIWNNHEEKAYVLEINTAPGLEGTTLDKYAHVFSNFLNNL